MVTFEPAEEVVNHSMYIVTFVDLLGQGDRLCRAHQVGLADPTSPDLSRAFSDIVGRMRFVRTAFAQYAKSRSELGAPPPGLPDELASDYPAFAAVSIRVQFFSDSVIVTTRLADGDRFGRWNVVNGIWQHLYGAAALSLFLFAHGVPIRGGTAIGPGIELEGEFVGYVLKEAYDLEHQHAGYPRIAVASTVRRVLRQSIPVIDPPHYGTDGSHLPASWGQLSEGSRAVARSAESLLLPHDADFDTLDFLSAEVRALGAPFDLALFKKAQAFAQAERHRLADDNKLRPRYDRLLSHFDRARGVWTT